MKILRKKISNFINKEFREFALYTISSRGIPNVLDCLTPVQRMILLNAPKSYKKTLSLVGDVIGTGHYHHGNASLESAIHKLAKEFQSSEPILLGDGFFGSIVNHAASSPRYTSIKINPMIDNIITKYKYLNECNSDGYVNNLNTVFPIGLVSMTLGISVGFVTKILPRKYEDIVKYLDGEKSDLIPYFKNWNGVIKRLEGNNKAWIFEPDVTMTDNKIIFNTIPPIMHFKNFIDKINSVVSGLNTDKITINNYSTDDVRLEIVFKNNDDMTEEVQKKIINAGKIIFTENIVFVYQDQIVQYQDIGDYLDDFRNKNQFIIKNNFKYILNKSISDLELNQAKQSFLKFMLEKKRTEKEVQDFIESVDVKLRDVLNNFKLKFLNKDEMIRLKESEKLLKKDININTDNVNKFKTSSECIEFKSTMINTQLFDAADGEIEYFMLEDDDIEEIETNA